MVLQIASLTGMAGIVTICAAVWRRWPTYWFMVVGPGAWALFGVIFYVFLLAGRLSPQATLMWGAAHRLMAVILILGIAVMLWAILSDVPPDGNEDGDE